MDGKHFILHTHHYGKASMFTCSCVCCSTFSWKTKWHFDTTRLVWCCQLFQKTKNAPHNMVDHVTPYMEFACPFNSAQNTFTCQALPNHDTIRVFMGHEQLAMCLLHNNKIVNPHKLTYMWNTSSHQRIFPAHIGLTISPISLLHFRKTTMLDRTSL